MHRSIAAVLFFAFCLSLAGQTITASLEGTVTDASGARIPGAKVRASNSATGVVTTVQTGADGRFVVVSLPAGMYSATVEAAGFKRAAVGQVIDNRSIVNAPLNQRNPYALVFTAPGVVGNVNAEFNQANISINGGRPGSNEILVDGIPSSPPLVNPIQGFTVYPSVRRRAGVQSPDQQLLGRVRA